MTFEEFIRRAKEELRKLTEKNTTYGSDGTPVILEDDPWFAEDIWNDFYKKEKE